MSPSSYAPGSGGWSDEQWRHIVTHARMERECREANRRAPRPSAHLAANFHARHVRRYALAAGAPA